MIKFFSRKLFVILRGGLGNQLFIYTAAQQFAKKHNINYINYINSGDLLIGSDFQLKKIQNINYYIKNISIKNDYLKNKYLNFIYIFFKYKLFNKVISEKNFFSHKQNLFNKNIIFDGFFQNKKFFESELNDILEKISKFCDKKKNKINNIKAVISLSLYSQFGYTIPRDYYISALKKLKIKKNDKILITSDDFWYGELFLNYLKMKGFKNTKLLKSQNKTAFDDFITIADSKNLIMSPSTFCWWASALRSKLGHIDSKVICPKKWLSKKNKKIFKDINLKIKNNWIYL